MSNPSADIFSPDVWRSVLQHAEIAVILLDLQGSVTAAEGAALRWIQGAPLVGQPVRDLSEDPAQIDALLARVSEGQISSARIRILNAAANFRIDSTTHALTNPEATPAGNRWWNVSCRKHSGGFLMIVEDATDLIEAQVARDEVLVGVQGILWHADVSYVDEEFLWDLRIVNEEMGQRFLPLSVPSNVTWGQVWVQSRHPEDNQRINRASSEALLAGVEGYHQTFRCYDAAGRVHWLREDVQVRRAAPDRWRLIGICTDLTEFQEQQLRLMEFQALADNALDPIVLFTPEGRVRYANTAATEQFRTGQSGTLMGLHATELIASQDRPRLAAEVMPSLTSGWRGEIAFVRADGSDWPAYVSVFAFIGPDGDHRGTVMIASDIGDRLRAELERKDLQEQLIQTQQAALRELSTPLIPLADNLVAMPLVGAIDGARAQQVMETLLEGIARLQAEYAIIDITGVRMVDTQVADALLRVARAAQLLGAQVILTGISAEVAQSLVQLGAELRGIATLPNLQAGIAYVMSKQERPE